MSFFPLSKRTINLPLRFPEQVSVQYIQNPQKTSGNAGVVQKNPQNFPSLESPLTSTVRLTTIALSELSLAASLSQFLVPDSTKAFDFPELEGTQAARAEREARFLLCLVWLMPDRGAEVASLLPPEPLRVVTSLRAVRIVGS
jgi:hypothetical protein